ncbi:MAG: serine-type D-Ala-D-Ala carboxypeptidase [Thermotogaceae bacterium]|nr:serine-type D-Ala-D-Ala carboxypeptidase [Thermotogaceae bacterium]MDN5338171.1 serine-type D-Ala-D-Ala carboxypeptidase [Thermotogaceae bacterium]
MTFKNMVEELFKKEFERETIPGFVILVGNSQKVLYKDSFGFKALKPSKEMNDTSTIYDLASLTKVVATTSAVMNLVETGKLCLFDPVAYYVDEFKENDKKDIRIFHLLTHSSGLPPYSELWRYLKGEELLKELLKIQPVYPPESKIVYSCLNFITLMKMVQNITNQRFDEFLYSTIFKPLDMNNTCFNPSEDMLERIAPTSERDGKILRGKVDDELAYYLGGVSGNAGLFSCVDDLYNLCRVYLNDGKHGTEKFFSKHTIRTFTETVVEIDGMKRALGWTINQKRSFIGDLFTDKAFGHTGFTGTSIVIDRSLDLCVIVLSNRTHIHRRETLDNIWDFRRRIHNLVVKTFAN